MAATVEGVFRILDEASPSLEKIMATAKGADKAVSSTGKTMTKVSGTGSADMEVLANAAQDVGQKTEEATAKGVVGWKEFQRTVSSATRGMSGDAAKLRAALKQVEGRYNIDITGKGDLIESTVLARRLRSELDKVQRQQAKTALGGLGLGAESAVPGAGGSGGGGPGMFKRIGGALTPFGLMPSLAAAAMGPIVDLTGAVGALAGSLGEAAIGVGALGVGGASIGAVGLAGIASIAVPAIAKIGELKKAQDAYNLALTTYGKSSSQANTAAMKLQATQKAVGNLHGFDPQSLHKMSKEWNNLTKGGQGQFFGMLGDGIKKAQDLMPAFAKSANSSMGAARKAVDHFLKRLDGPDFRKFLGSMTHNFKKDIGPVMDTLANVGTVIGRIATAVGPDMNHLVKQIEHTTGGWVKSTNNAKKLRGEVHEMVSQTRTWGHLLGTTWDLMKAALGPGANQGQGMVSRLSKTFEGWTSYLTKHPGAVKKFYRDSVQGAGDLFQAIGGFIPTIKNFYTAFRPISGVIEKVVTALNGIHIGNITGLTAILGGLTAKRMSDRLTGKGGISGSRGPIAPGSRLNPIAVTGGIGGPGSKVAGVAGGGAGAAAAESGPIRRFLGRSATGRAVTEGAANLALRFPRTADTILQGGAALRGLGKIPILGGLLAGYGALHPRYGNSPQSRLWSGASMLDPTALAGMFGIGPKNGVVDWAARKGGVGQPALSPGNPEAIATALGQKGVPYSFAYQHIRNSHASTPGMLEAQVTSAWARRSATGQFGMPNIPGGGLLASLAGFSAAKDGGKAASDFLGGVTKKLGDGKHDVSKGMVAVQSALVDPVKNTHDQVIGITGDMTDKTVQSLASLSNAYGTTMNDIESQLNKGLTALGSKPISWGAASAVSSTAGKVSNFITGGGKSGGGKSGSKKHAHGGYIPGSGMHDHVPVPGGMAAPGEAWIANGPTQRRLDGMLRPYGTSLRREILGERQPHNVPDAQNKYKHGGQAGKALSQSATGAWRGAYGKAGLHPGIIKMAETVMGKYPGLQISSTTGGSHVSGSLHYSGDAVDISGSSGDMFSASAWIKSSGLYKSLNEGIHNPNLAVDHGVIESGAGPYGGVWAEHANHIHLGVTDPATGIVATGVGGVATMMGRSAQKIGRSKLKGPNSGIGALAQGALDHMTKAGNKKLGAGVGGGMTAAGVSGGSVPAQIARVLFSGGFNKVGAAGIIGNAYAESTWNPTATDGAGNGGLWGFTSSPYSMADMEAWTGKQGLSWQSAAAQTQFLMQFIGGMRGKLNAAASPEAAAEIFMTDFEKPGIPRLDVRQSGARKAFSMGYSRGGQTAPDWGGWHKDGGTFTVNRPTVFGAGEAGPETVKISKGSRGMGDLHVHIGKIENHREGDVARMIENEFEKLGRSISASGGEE